MPAAALTGPATASARPLTSVNALGALAPSADPATANPPSTSIWFSPSSCALLACPVSVPTRITASAASMMLPALRSSSVLTAERSNIPLIPISPVVAEPTRKLFATIDPPDGTKLPSVSAVPGVSGANATVPPGASNWLAAPSEICLLASDSVAPPPTLTVPPTVSACPSANAKSPAVVKLPSVVTALSAEPSAALAPEPVSSVAVRLPAVCVIAPVAAKSTSGAVTLPASVNAPATFNPIDTGSVTGPATVNACPSLRRNPRPAANVPSVAIAFPAESSPTTPELLPVSNPAAMLPLVC